MHYETILSCAKTTVSKFYLLLNIWEKYLLKVLSNALKVALGLIWTEMRKLQQ